MSQRKYTHVALSNAIMDYCYPITDLQVQAFSLNKGDFQGLPPEQQLLLEQACGKPHVSCGGSICNTLYGMGLLGNTRGCSLAPMGDDADGLTYRAEFASVGVDCLPSRPGEATMAINVMISPDAQRTFVTRRKELRHTLTDTMKEAIANADWLLLEGYLMFNNAALLVEAAAYAKKVGTKVALFVSAASVPQFCANALFAIIRDGVDLLVCNETEMQALMAATRSQTEARELSGAIHFTPRIVTHGAGGATFMSEADYVYGPIPNSNVKRVDTNGCGDAFAAGFLDGYFRNLPIEECLAQGHALASQVIQQLGARLPCPVPQRETA